MLNLHAKTTAPASRDSQENDIDAYVRLGSLATIVKKARLKIIKINFVFHCNTGTYSLGWFIIQYWL